MEFSTQNAEAIYNEAKASLGKHITLNNAVPADVGCAEAVSFVLKNAGVQNLPAQGYAGTADLYVWLHSNPRFMALDAPEAGAIIISPTGYGNGSVEGHTGILGGFGVQFPYEFGILSNNSDNGLFQEVWSLPAWGANYGTKGGLPVAFFRAL
jgi:hypothetical protein